MDIVVTPKKHLRADKFCLALAESELLPLFGELSVLSSAETPAANPTEGAA
jgi:hypothetical protein